MYRSFLRLHPSFHALPEYAKLRTILGEAQAKRETWWLLEHVTGETRHTIQRSSRLPATKDGLTQFLQPKQYERMCSLVHQRAVERKPLQYLIGDVKFLGLDLHTQPPILIPRPETELMTAWVIQRWKKRDYRARYAHLSVNHEQDTFMEMMELMDKKQETTNEKNTKSPATVSSNTTDSSETFTTASTPCLRILDLCCGSGNIALSLSHHMPYPSYVVGCDINPSAIALSTSNHLHQLQHHGDVWKESVSAKARLGVRFMELDLLQSGAPSNSNDDWTSKLGSSCVNLIISNPPYIPHRELAGLQAEVRDWEDPRALCSGEEGLDVINSICEGAPKLLYSTSAGRRWWESNDFIDTTQWDVPELVLEIGSEEQAKAVSQKLCQLGFEHVTIHLDLAGLPRWIAAARSKSVTSGHTKNTPTTSSSSSFSSSSSSFRGFVSIPKYSIGDPIRLSVNNSCEMTRTFSLEDVRKFGAATMNWHPLHYPDTHQRTIEAETKKWKESPYTAHLPLPTTGVFRFKKPIVPGPLTASLIGTLFDTHLPGSTVISQNLHFCHPVYHDEPVTAEIQVTSIYGKRVIFSIRVWKVDPAKSPPNEKVVVIEGEASVFVEGLVTDLNSLDQPPPPEWQEEDRFLCLAEATWMRLRQRELEDLTSGKMDAVNMGMLKDTRFIQSDSNHNSSAAALPLTVSSDLNILPIQLPFMHIPTSELFRPLTPNDYALVEKYISLDYANMIQSLRLKNDFEHKRVEFIDRIMLAGKDYQFVVMPPHNVSQLTQEGQRLLKLAKSSPQYRKYSSVDLYRVLENAYGVDIVDSWQGKTLLLLREVELFHMISNQLETKLSVPDAFCPSEEMWVTAIQRFRHLAQIRMNEFMLLFPAAMQYMDSDEACTQSVRCKFILFYFQCLFLSSSQDPTRLKQIGPMIDHVAANFSEAYLDDHARNTVASSDSFVRLTKLRGKYYQLIGDHTKAVEVYQSIPRYHYDDPRSLDASLEDLPSDTMYELSISYFHSSSSKPYLDDYCFRGLTILDRDVASDTASRSQHLYEVETHQDHSSIRDYYTRNQLQLIFYAMCTNHLKLIQKLVEQGKKKELLKLYPHRITAEDLISATFSPSVY